MAHKVRRSRRRKRNGKTRLRVRKLVRRIKVPVLASVIVALNGFVHLATGLLPLLGWTVDLDTVLGRFGLAAAVRTSGMVSIALGAFLIVLGKGLFERRRRSWVTCIVVLVILIANNLYRSTTPQTAILSGILLVLLIVFRRQFSLPTVSTLGYAQIVALVSILFALAYGVGGTYLLREEFEGVASLSDAVYYTVVSYSTVGYGDISPISDRARMFVSSMIPIGLAAFAMALTALVGPALERRIEGVLTMMQRQQSLNDHVIVCGYSSVSQTVLSELAKTRSNFVVIEDRVEVAEMLRGRGYRVLAGDPTHGETLRAAGLPDASAVICACDTDSANVLIAVTAKEIRDAGGRPTPRIIVRIEDEENIIKAEHVGADEVISPSTLGGKLMAAQATESGEQA